MRFTKSLIIAAMAMLCSVGMKAQDDATSYAEAQDLGYKPYPYWFIQAQGGINSVFTDVAIGKHLAPTASIGFGRMFTPIVGARLHFNGWKTTGAFVTMTGPKGAAVAGENIAAVGDSWQVIGDPLKYSYNYITSDIDVMINVLNIFSKKVHRPVDLYLIGGLGLSYAWNNKEFEDITKGTATTQAWPVANDISNAWGPSQTPRHSLLSHNIRFGALVDYNFAKNWSVGVEADLNSLDDRFNSKYTNSDDWMLTAQISLTYKFGFKKPTAPVAEPVRVAPDYADQQQTEVAKGDIENPDAEAAAKEEEPLKETIFYAIRENTPNPDGILNKVATWAKKYPNKKIEVSGYADKGTGNPTINKMYSEKRAQSVCQDLIKKGVPASQMIVNSYGDTVQPFAENDQNRCVIIIGGK